MKKREKTKKEEELIAEKKENKANAFLHFLSLLSSAVGDSLHHHPQAIFFHSPSKVNISIHQTQTQHDWWFCWAEEPISPLLPSL